ncbi:MAG TPA: glycosyltransferase family 39 protein [Thermoleophilaceae bacterium]|nr:glycosyltransferase family 39 protein [Thermoleophilaceae bacterium]
MSTVAAPRTRPLARVSARIPPRVATFVSSPAGIALLVVLLLLISLYLRTRALGASLWMDEGLSIGIAGQPFFDIPGVLRQDGSPPLYYMLLHGWMELVGNSPADTQGLSVAIALLAVPGGLWAGWSLFGRRAGLICAALAAVNPFLTAYAQETRMYSLMVVLSLVATAAFLHVFVYRHRRYLPLFAAVMAALLYTHSWGIFATAGAVLTFAFVWFRSDERGPLLKDAALGFGIAFLLYLPWIPTLLYQAAHTGAPWLNPPRFGVAIQVSKSLLGGGSVTVALVLAAGSGIAAILFRRADDRERRAVYATIAIGVFTLAVAWLFSQISPAWTTRYLGVALGPVLILAALGLARAGTLGLVAFVIVFGIWGVTRSGGLENKSNAADLAAAVQGTLQPGDLVVTLQPEQAPLMHYHLPGGLQGDLVEATQLGEVDTKGVMDWRDVQERLEAATPEKNLEPLLDRLPRSQRVLLVYPVTTNIGDWDAPWTETVRRRAAQWGRALELDDRFELDGAVPPFYRRAGRIGVRGVLYTKTAD